MIDDRTALIHFIMEDVEDYGDLTPTKIYLWKPSILKNLKRIY